MQLPDLPGEWWMFVCAACGEETFVCQMEDQNLEDFGRASAMIYGDPPVCTACQREQLAG